MGGNALGVNIGFGLLGLFGILAYIGAIVITIYLIVSTIRFFKHKTQNDKELLKRMDELIRIKSQE